VDVFFPHEPGHSSYAVNHAMATDASGNVYAVGETYDHHLNHGVAVIRQKPTGGSTWQTVAAAEGTNVSNAPAAFYAVAVAPSGNVYVGGQTDGQFKIWKGTWSNGSLSLAVVDNSFHCQDLAVDAAGNVFAAGFTSVRKGNSYIRHWVVRKQSAGQGAFVTVDDMGLIPIGAGPTSVSLVSSGPAAGVYVGGVSTATNGAFQWMVRKSINGGSTWTTVDAFQYDPATRAPSHVRDMAAHEDGSLHVVGVASTGVRSGGTNKNPTYTYTYRWFMRSSSNGGASWSSHNIYPGNQTSSTLSVTTDSTGNVYVAGSQVVDGTPHSVVRSNVGGDWSTSDDYYGSWANTMTRDAAGTVYVGGEVGVGVENETGWIVRSMAPAAPLAPMGATGGSLFSDSQISSAGNELLAELA
jgi:hypothetical protein